MPKRRPIFPLLPMLGALSAAGALVGTGLAAQSRKSHADVPVARPVIIKPIQPQEESVLTDMPRGLILADEWTDWERPALQMPGPLPGKRRVSVPGSPCRAWRDTINLALIRANGFRVVGIEFSAAAKPSGYTEIVRGYSTPLKTVRERYLNAHDPAEIDRIAVNSTIYALEIGKKRVACIASWRLSIRVKGPKGISPFSGKPR